MPRHFREPAAKVVAAERANQAAFKKILTDIEAQASKSVAELLRIPPELTQQQKEKIMATTTAGNNVLSLEEMDIIHRGLDAIEKGELPTKAIGYILDVIRHIIPHAHHAPATTPAQALIKLRNTIENIEGLYG